MRGLAAALVVLSMTGADVSGQQAVSGDSGPAVVSGFSGGVGVAAGRDLLDLLDGPAVELWYDFAPVGRVAFPVGAAVSVDAWSVPRVCTIGGSGCSRTPPSRVFTGFVEPRVRAGAPDDRVRPSVGARFSLVGIRGRAIPGVGAVAGLEGAVLDRWWVHGRLVVDYILTSEDPNAWMTPRIGMRLGITHGL